MQLFWYFVGNQRSGECSDVVASSDEAACEEQGWPRAQCVVIRVGKVDAKVAFRMHQRAVATALRPVLS